MRKEIVNGVELGIADMVEWKEPDSGEVQHGFVTVYGNPFSHQLIVVGSETRLLVTMDELRKKRDVRKTGQLS